MNTPVSDIASPGTLSFLHHDDTSLEDLYDASDGLIHLAQHAGVALEGATPQEIIRWAHDRFGQRFAIAASMADGVMAHLAGTVAPGIRVLFLDTGYHFAETLGTRDAVTQVYGVNLVEAKAAHSVAEQDELLRAARESGVRVIGPNCQGALSVPSRMWCVFGSVSQETQLREGPVSCAFQSGGFGYAVVNMAEAQWIATKPLPPSTKSSSAFSCEGVIVVWLAYIMIAS